MRLDTKRTEVTVNPQFPTPATVGQINLCQYVPQIEALLNAPPAYPEKRFTGRGIVTCAGGRRLFACAWVLVNGLRRLGCELPIEVWYRGQAEMSRRMIDLLESVPGVRCMDAFEHIRQHHTGPDGRPAEGYRAIGGWELKSYAILNCAFEQVLFLDADNLPTRDPSFLFDEPTFRDSGAIFWKDRYAGPDAVGIGLGERYRTLHPEAWETVGLADYPHKDEAEWEAGQFLVDKKRCWTALQLAALLNEHSEFFYRFIHGDKDTFRLAWHKCHLAGRADPACVVPHPPAQDQEDGPVIYQHDLAGQRLFQHRCGDKWNYDGGNRFLENYAHEQMCHDLLAELRRRWDGIVRRFPEDYTPAERHVHEELTRERFFWLTTTGGARKLELRPDFTIGQGAGDWESCWGLEPTLGGDVRLFLSNGMRRTCNLRPMFDGNTHGEWVGHRLHLDHGPVSLRPLTSAIKTR